MLKSSSCGGWIFYDILIFMKKVIIFSHPTPSPLLCKHTETYWNRIIVPLSTVTLCDAVPVWVREEAAIHTPCKGLSAQGKLTSVTAAVHGDHWHTIGSWPHPNTHPPYFPSDPLSLCDRHVFQTSTKFNAVLFCWLLSSHGSKHTSCMIIHLVGDNKQPSVESYYPF